MTCKVSRSFCCSHFPVALSAPDFLDTVLFISHDHNWFVAAGLLFREFGVGHDDYHIPGLDAAGCGSVQADDTGSSLARYDIGFPAGTVVVEGEPVDVVTEGDFVTKGDIVKVINVEGSRVVVRRI